MVETLCGVSMAGVETLVAACWAVTVTVPRSVVVDCANKGVVVSAITAAVRGAKGKRLGIKSIGSPASKESHHFNNENYCPLLAAKGMRSDKVVMRTAKFVAHRGTLWLGPSVLGTFGDIVWGDAKHALKGSGKVTRMLIATVMRGLLHAVATFER